MNSISALSLKSKRTLRRILVRLIAVGVVLFYFGPFLDENELTQLAVDASGNALSRMYVPKSQSEVAVVLIDDEDLDKLAENWPIAYQKWAKLLVALGCAQVKAVFFDLIFARAGDFEKKDSGGLSFALADEKLSSGGLGAKDCPGQRGLGPVPVYYSTHDPADEDLLPTLRDRHRLLPVAWTGSEHSYPLFIGERASPALELYRVWCRAVSGSSPCKAGFIGADQSLRLMPHWTQRLPKEVPDSDLCSGYRQPNGLAEAIVLWVQEHLPMYGAREMNPGCRPILTLHLADLLDQGGPDGQLLELLKGRLILIGQNIVGAGDFAVAKTHGKLPGVYVHAVAVENLLSMGESFERVDVRSIAYVCMGLLILITLWDEYVRIRYSKRQTLLHAFLLGAVFFALAVYSLKDLAMFPAGGVPRLALMLSIGLMFGELSVEGRIHEWLNRTFG